jgi:TP901 family phage tail tape measure protein
MATTRGIKAGRAFVELFVDNSLLVHGLRLAQRKIQAFGRQITALGRKMAAIGTLILAPIALSTKVFAEFDDQMRAVQAVLGATGDDFDDLTEKAKELGRTTSFTASQVAGAMLNLARAGFSAKEIDAAIASMLNLARATGIDLSEAAEIAADTLRGFGLAASDMTRVADVLVAAANNSSQTLTDLSESMRLAAPIADAYGLTLEETALALGNLANFGIKGSRAGTSLRKIMLQLIKPDVRRKIEALGVSVTDAAGNMRPINDVLRDLGVTLSQFPEGDVLAFMADVFQVRAVAGALKLTEADFEALTNAIANADGVAASAAETMDKGIGGAMRRLKSAVEGIALAIGDTMADGISDMAEKLREAAGTVVWFIKRNRVLIITIAKIAGITLAAGAALIALGTIITNLGAIIGVLVTVLTTLGSILSMLATAIAFLVTPIGLVITSLVALGAVLLHVTGIAGRAVEWLGERFAGLKDDVSRAMEGIGNAIAAGDISLAMKILWLTFKIEWIKGIAVLKQLWVDFKTFFLITANDAWSALKIGWEDAVHGIARGIFELMTGFKRFWLEVRNGFSVLWVAAVTDTKEAALAMRAALDPTFTQEDALRQMRMVRAEGALALTRLSGQRALSIQEQVEDYQSGVDDLNRIHKEEIIRLGQENIDACDYLGWYKGWRCCYR